MTTEYHTGQKHISYCPFCGKKCIWYGEIPSEEDVQSHIKKQHISGDVQ